VLCLILLIAVCTANARVWERIKARTTFAASTALLLHDGRVMVQDSGAADWWALTPDINGSYLYGTWSQLASLLSGYAPLYYASAVLPDGRVVVFGGEYNHGRQDWTNLGAIYDPTTDTWETLNAPAGWTTLGDAQSVILADGNLMLADCCSFAEAILHDKNLNWRSTGSGKADENDEEGWTLLPNGEVLTVDTNSGSNYSEIYNPATGAWSYAGNTVADVVDYVADEIGPAILRPDGTVLQTGATGHNAIYNTVTSAWSAAPDFPILNGKQMDIADGPAALLPNGNVLCMTSPGVYGFGVQFYEWDGTSFTATKNTPKAPYDSSYFGRMLVLPTGQILLTDGSNDVEIYTSKGTPDPSWVPTITKVDKVLTHGKNYALQGTQLNGLSQGAAYGDDAQMATNYPLVRITNQATGHVFFARTYNPSSMGVATGSLIVSVHFEVPETLELGASELSVVANGIASTLVSVKIK
jgi:hypothetical protein